MAPIKTVAITAASGALGSVLFKKLVDSGKFKVRVLKRIGSSSIFPAGTDVVEVDYTSYDSLLVALEGQDAVISAVTSEETGSQFPLIDAAIAAGVKRFLPSEFGSNLDNPKTRQLPVFAAKAKTQDYLASKAKSTDLTYTFLYNSAFLDWGLENKFILDGSGGESSILNGGDIPFSTTTLSSVGDAVIGILTHLEETKNRSVFVRDIEITQNQLLAIGKKVAPHKEWTTKEVNVDDAVSASNAALASGNFNFYTFIPYLWQAIVNPAYGGDFGRDNELLGVKGITEEDIAEMIKKLAQ